MTTVIADMRHGLVIADSFQEHNGNTMFTSGEKMLRTEIGILAWSGIHSHAQLWAEWMSEGCERASRPTLTDTSCLHLAMDGQLWWYGEKCIPSLIREPYYTIGAGCEFALAALYCGKTALEAMRVAAHFNAFTKPPFRMYTLKSEDVTIYET